MFHRHRWYPIQYEDVCQSCGKRLQAENIWGRIWRDTARIQAMFNSSEYRQIYIREETLKRLRENQVLAKVSKIKTV